MKTWRQREYPTATHRLVQERRTACGQRCMQTDLTRCPRKVRVACDQHSFCRAKRTVPVQVTHWQTPKSQVLCLRSLQSLIACHQNLAKHAKSRHAVVEWRREDPQPTLSELSVAQTQAKSPSDFKKANTQHTTHNTQHTTHTLRCERAAYWM